MKEYDSVNTALNTHFNNAIGELEKFETTNRIVRRENALLFMNKGFGRITKEYPIHLGTLIAYPLFEGMKITPFSVKTDSGVWDIAYSIHTQKMDGRKCPKLAYTFMRSYLLKCSITQILTKDFEELWKLLQNLPSTSLVLE